ncbi:MAG: hypothetical protein FWG65_09195 [Turicibacter sp.]|nr:hypothetical protein [Turicibacter sp.]
MVQTIENGQEMYCWQIAEKYPDHYILIKMVETDYETGKRTGIPLVLSDVHADLFKYDIEDSNVITGYNLTFRIGGFL